MPIHPIGEVGPGHAGQSHAIRDYRGVNRSTAPWRISRHLVDAIHVRGMKCIIDVVYNHTRRIRCWPQTHPEWFFHDSRVGPAPCGGLVGCSRPGLYPQGTVALPDRYAENVGGDRGRLPAAMWPAACPWTSGPAARQEVEAVRPGCIWLAESVHGAHVLGLRRQGAYCATDTELYRAFDMTYDYDIWPWFEGYLSGKTACGSTSIC